MPCPCLLFCAHRVLRVRRLTANTLKKDAANLSIVPHRLIERTRTSTVIDACFLFWHYDITPRPISWDLASPHPVFISDTETLGTELQKTTRLVLMAEHSILTGYCNHAWGIGCVDCHRRLRIFTSHTAPSLLPASAANKQGTGTGVSKCCAIKGLVSELACSRFEQLLRLRLTTRDAPFLRTCNSLLSAPLSSKSRLRTPRKLDELLNTPGQNGTGQAQA
ncbi:hypothetical protein J3E69DRAFT_375180 [Trichoderma sp. SZMC 28015]